jgi:hypothetical protein
MKKLICAAFFVCLALPVATRAQSEGVVLPQDKGPKSIDVYTYPAEQQQNYKLFVSRCSKCHTLARPINTTMSTPEWMRYVNTMQHKPSSSITEPQAKEISEFLTYDQSVRKNKNASAFFRNLSDDEINALRNKN